MCSRLDNAFPCECATCVSRMSSPCASCCGPCTARVEQYLGRSVALWIVCDTSNISFSPTVSARCTPKHMVVFRRENWTRRSFSCSLQGSSKSPPVCSWRNYGDCWLTLRAALGESRQHSCKTRRTKWPKRRYCCDAVTHG